MSITLNDAFGDGYDENVTPESQEEQYDINNSEEFEGGVNTNSAINGLNEGEFNHGGELIDNFSGGGRVTETGNEDTSNYIPLGNIILKNKANKILGIPVRYSKTYTEQPSKKAEIYVGSTSFEKLGLTGNEYLYGAGKVFANYSDLGTSYTVGTKYKVTFICLAWQNYDRIIERVDLTTNPVAIYDISTNSPITVMSANGVSTIVYTNMVLSGVSVVTTGTVSPYTTTEVKFFEPFFTMCFSGVTYEQKPNEYMYDISGKCKIIMPDRRQAISDKDKKLKDYKITVQFTFRITSNPNSVPTVSYHTVIAESQLNMPQDSNDFVFGVDCEDCNNLMFKSDDFEISKPFVTNITLSSVKVISQTINGEENKIYVIHSMIV